MANTQRIAPRTPRTGSAIRAGQAAQSVPGEAIRARPATVSVVRLGAPLARLVCAHSNTSPGQPRSAAADREPSKGRTMTLHMPAEAARATWATVARATSEFTPVTVVVTRAQTEHAERHLGEGLRHPITVVNAELDDAWMRDIGPSFVVDEAGGLRAVDWVFNGWGAQEWAKWDHDEHIGGFVAELTGTPVVSSQLRNEGGGFHVDGKGTVLATRSVQLDPGRNPGISEDEVEAEFARTIGAKKVIWLDHGLHRDNQTYGTRGHVDIVATMPSPGVVLVHDQRNPEHPDFEFSRELKELFAAETTADGVPFD